MLQKDPRQAVASEGCTAGCGISGPASYTQASAAHPSFMTHYFESMARLPLTCKLFNTIYDVRDRAKLSRAVFVNLMHSACVDCM